MSKKSYGKYILKTVEDDTYPLSTESLSLDQARANETSSSTTSPTASMVSMFPSQKKLGGEYPLNMQNSRLYQRRMSRKPPKPPLRLYQRLKKLPPARPKNPPPPLPINKRAPPRPKNPPPQHSPPSRSMFPLPLLPSPLPTRRVPSQKRKAPSRPKNPSPIKRRVPSRPRNPPPPLPITKRAPSRPRNPPPPLPVNKRAPPRPPSPRFLHWAKL